MKLKQCNTIVMKEGLYLNNDLSRHMTMFTNRFSGGSGFKKHRDHKRDLTLKLLSNFH